MPTPPTVSVVIPAYNAAQFLPAAIASVQAQTLTDWELLIIDDGSIDHTAAVVQPFLQRDRRIQLIRQTNQGVSAARTHGVEHSQGDLIAFLDADDLWLPHKLATHLAQFKADPCLGVSFDQVEFLTQAGESTGQVSSARLKGLTPKHFLSENPTTTTSSWVLRRRVWQQVGGFCLPMSYSEDLEWLLRVACTQDWRIEGIKQILTRYRTSNGGLSADLYRMEAGWNVLVDQAKTYAPDLVRQEFAISQAIHLRYLARRAFRLKLPSKVGVDFMNRALQSDQRLLVSQPRRTLPTMVAVYGHHLLSTLKQVTALATSA
jgi:glycosyltransferase involved in cell wall biosynthesis